ncbi:MAG: DUF3604 domain-containing protein, partial [Pseudomonadales bacterium]
PVDCHESAGTPADLFARLNEWRSEYMVIPHGNAWGLYTPPGSSWEKQLRGDSSGSDRQNLIEVFSGHGSSEEYRSWRGVAYDAAGEAYCPPPADGYVPCCWQAGEIIRRQCSDPESTQCDTQVEQAKLNHVAAGASGHLTVTGVNQDDWHTCGQCPDCFLPAFSLRPGMSAQAALVTGEFSQQQAKHFRFGFIASSDNHSARPGTGYKEFARTAMTDVAGPTQEWESVRQKNTADGIASVAPAQLKALPDNVFNGERRASFLYTGGLVAAHSEGRTRDAIWNALRRKEVYGTSGPRLLLWFDAIDAQGERHVMGSELSLNENPRFEVRAMGAFKQNPGCPADSQATLGPARLQRLCRGECYNPSDTRHPIVRIEVVKVTPQISASEPLDGLIQDPWRVFPCDAGGVGCVVRFSDEEYLSGGRSAAYYVRAIQNATPTVNGAQLRCEHDESGQCVKVHPCHGDFRTAADDDCLALVEHRAWSSPIFIDQAQR